MLQSNGSKTYAALSIATILSINSFFVPDTFEPLGFIFTICLSCAT